jgi:hypothetical protein
MNVRCYRRTALPNIRIGDSGRLPSLCQLSGLLRWRWHQNSRVRLDRRQKVIVPLTVALQKAGQLPARRKLRVVETVTISQRTEVIHRNPGCPLQLGSIVLIGRVHPAHARQYMSATIAFCRNRVSSIASFQSSFSNIGTIASSASKQTRSAIAQYRPLCSASAGANTRANQFPSQRQRRSGTIW